MPSKRLRPRRDEWLKAVVFAVVLALPLATCAGDERLLDGVVADPLARLAVPGADETARIEEPQHEALGKTVYAEVSVRYRIRDGADPDAVLADAVAAAESKGWEVDASREGVTMVAHKRLEPGRGEASFAILEIGGRDHLVLVMRYDPPLE